MRERVLLPPCVPEQCGKDFRYTLRKPSPNYPHGSKTKKPRVVPAFTIQGKFYLCAFQSVNSVKEKKAVRKPASPRTNDLKIFLTSFHIVDVVDGFFFFCGTRKIIK